MFQNFFNLYTHTLFLVHKPTGVYKFAYTHKHNINIHLHTLNKFSYTHTYITFDNVFHYKI